jgi:uncharacterized protein GlcG (DUF336 family)
MQNRLSAILALSAALMLSAPLSAQQPAPMPPTTSYGPTITLEQAKKAADAAEAEARKRNMKMAIAIVEPTGELVYFRKMDDTQYASIKIAQEKAISAAIFRRSTKDFFDRVAKGDLSPMALSRAVSSAGGVPIVVSGKIIGAIGTSGGADDPIAQAGADALK